MEMRGLNSEASSKVLASSSDKGKSHYTKIKPVIGKGTIKKSCATKRKRVTTTSDLVMVSKEDLSYAPKNKFLPVRKTYNLRKKKITPQTKDNDLHNKTNQKQPEAHPSSSSSSEIPIDPNSEETSESENEDFEIISLLNLPGYSNFLNTTEDSTHSPSNLSYEDESLVKQHRELLRRYFTLLKTGLFFDFWVLSTCLQCKRWYSCPRDASRCLKSHSLRRCWKCNQTWKSLGSRQSDFAKHNRRVHKIPPSQKRTKCPYCSHSFKINIQLRQHIEEFHFELPRHQLSVDFDESNILPSSVNSNQTTRPQDFSRPTGLSIDYTKLCRIQISLPIPSQGLEASFNIFGGSTNLSRRPRMFISQADQSLIQCLFNSYTNFLGLKPFNFISPRTKAKQSRPPKPIVSSTSSESESEENSSTSKPTNSRHSTSPSKKAKQTSESSALVLGFTTQMQLEKSLNTSNETHPPTKQIELTSESSTATAVSLECNSGDNNSSSNSLCSIVQENPVESNASLLHIPVDNNEVHGSTVNTPTSENNALGNNDLVTLSSDSEPAIRSRCPTPVTSEPCSNNWLLNLVHPVITSTFTVPCTSTSVNAPSSAPVSDTQSVQHNHQRSSVPSDIPTPPSPKDAENEITIPNISQPVPAKEFRDVEVVSPESPQANDLNNTVRRNDTSLPPPNKQSQLNETTPVETNYESDDDIQILFASKSSQLQQRPHCHVSVTKTEKDSDPTFPQDSFTSPEEPQIDNVEMNEQTSSLPNLTEMNEQQQPQKQKQITTLEANESSAHSNKISSSACVEFSPNPRVNSPVTKNARNKKPQMAQDDGDIQLIYERKVPNHEEFITATEKETIQKDFRPKPVGLGIPVSVISSCQGKRKMTYLNPTVIENSIFEGKQASKYVENVLHQNKKSVIVNQGSPVSCGLRTFQNPREVTAKNKVQVAEQKIKHSPTDSEILHKPFYLDYSLNQSSGSAQEIFKKFPGLAKLTSKRVLTNLLCANFIEAEKVKSKDESFVLRRLSFSVDSEDKNTEDLIVEVSLRIFIYGMTLKYKECCNSKWSEFGWKALKCISYNIPLQVSSGPNESPYSSVLVVGVEEVKKLVEECNAFQLHKPRPNDIHAKQFLDLCVQKVINVALDSK